MKRVTSLFWLPLIIIGFSLVSAAQDLKPVQLPPPQTSGGRPLMEVLRDRHTTREWSTQPLSLQTLSSLLWAAWGINRPDGHRTAPSDMNRQATTIYVVNGDGAYWYDAKTNTLNPVLLGDIRASTGTQPYVKFAPLDLIYVADLTKDGPPTPSEPELYNAADVGFIGQNVYLYMASEGLVGAFRNQIDRVALSKLLKLQPTQRIMFAQAVGYPKK
jgi:nitroreductase